MTQVNVNAKGDQITLLQGQAPKPVENQPYKFSGNIRAPFTFLESFESRMMHEVKLPEGDAFYTKSDFLDFMGDPCVCEVVSRDTEVSVAFLIGIGKDDQWTVQGTLLPNPVLEELGINRNKEYQPRELSDLLKRNRVLFDDFEKNAELVAGLREVKARVERDLEEASDKRGNKRSLDDKKVETGLPQNFVLNCPIFKGGEKRKFLVEVCVDVRSTGVSIWLESVELIEIQRQQVEDVQHAAEMSFGKYMPVLFK